MVQADLTYILASQVLGLQMCTLNGFRFVLKNQYVTLIKNYFSHRIKSLVFNLEISLEFTNYMEKSG